jgi:hypothetical protein
MASIQSTPKRIYDAEPATDWLRRFSVRGVATRLFVTCWLIYSLHVATNTVREIYLALAIADHFSFRVDEYANIHPDLFEKPGYGWHIGANPGGSMLGAVPYALFRPLVDPLLARVNRQRALGLASGKLEPPKYNSPWPKAQWFFEESWKRGLDVKFGIAALIMQIFCMAPISALGVVAMYLVLRQYLPSEKEAVGLALLYGIGTPVFFRTGYLNHNMILGHVTFFGFLAMWNAPGSARWSAGTRYFLGGLAGGMALLLDYSGVVLLLGLFVYALVRTWQDEHRLPVRNGLLYVLGTLLPVFLLWWYQYRSFGHPLYPGQHWMPPVEWIDRGYQGFSFPQFEILISLLIDHRYGLLTTCPLFLLAVAAIWLNRKGKSPLPSRELTAALLLAGALLLFCSSINYTRLQFNTGIRYLAPSFPYLFLGVAVAFMNLSRQARYWIAAAAITQAWCMAMYRDVERGLGVFEPILHVFTGGFQLPVLTVAYRMEQFKDYFMGGPSPLPLFAVCAVLIYGIWRFGGKQSKARSSTPSSTHVR